MRRKIYHEVSAGTAPAKPKVFTVDILKTKNVTIRLGRSYIGVSCEMSTAGDPAKMLSTQSPVFARGIKAAMLLYMMHYGQPFRFREVRCRVGEQTEIFSFDDKHPLIYSLIAGKLKSLPLEWQQQKLSETVIRLSQKIDDRRNASLNSYLLGKSASASETERFRCMWTAINGLYEFYNHIILGVKDFIENTHIQRFLHLYSPECVFLGPKERYDCMQDMNVLIFRTLDFRSAVRDPSSPLCEQVRAALGRTVNNDRRIDPYLYYLFQHTYTLRCKYFHAEAPVKLLSFAEESEIILLRACSDLMEDYLDHNLHKWFDDDYIENVKNIAIDGSAALPIF